MESIFNIFKCVNNATTVREQWFLFLYSKFMWFYCLCVDKKKKTQNTERKRAKQAIQIQTGTLNNESKWAAMKSITVPEIN